MASAQEISSAADRFAAFVRHHLKHRAIGPVSKRVEASLSGGLSRRVAIATFGHGAPISDANLPDFASDDEKLKAKLKKYNAMYRVEDFGLPLFKEHWHIWTARFLRFVCVCVCVCMCVCVLCLM